MLFDHKFGRNGHQIHKFGTVIHDIVHVQVEIHPSRGDSKLIIGSTHSIYACFLSR